MTEPPEQEASPPSRRLVVRFSIGVVALAFVSLMNRALGAAVEEFSRTGVVPPFLITLYIGFAVLGGLAFGLAVALPRRIPSYQWRRALILAVLPAVVVAVNVLAFTSPGFLPSWVLELEFLFGLHVATVGAVLVGVAASSAFAES